MAIRPNITQTVYVHYETTNKSFIDMHHYLKDIGIKNNNFFLFIYDKDLIGVDPRDPKLNTFMKQKVLRECMVNFYYFIREVIRIPDEGGVVGLGKRYQLHRGNLAMNFGFMLNWNMFVELPRQRYKTISAACRMLWAFNFGTSNSEMMFMNKKHDDSKLNLARLKAIRETLPSYLRMDQAYGIGGNKIKPKDTVEYLEHTTNGNSIKTLPSARNRIAANSLGRGCTQPIQWYDEYAFIPFIGLIYQAATPAYKTAAMNAKANNSPFGILITTTPGDLKTDEGLEAYETKNNATKFDERFYDYTPDFLQEILYKNTSSKFVYIRFTYQQLGCDEEWFRDIVIEMKKDWSSIRREVLLEWSTISDNSPFNKEDLNIVRGLVKEPIRTILIGGYYQMNIYNEMYPDIIPILGADVSGGFKRDSSTITVVCSKTTTVIATFNCNYISVDDFAKVIYELVTKYMPRAVVNIERTGGYGNSVLSKLINSSIKRNLYFEIKDRVIEERYHNGQVIKSTKKTKIYGLDTTKQVRDQLMEILRERMKYHKDKFVCPVIYNELEGLEVKRSGRIEHSANSHDDQVISLLLALYVWYEGRNLLELYGIEKSSIKTDEDMEGALMDIEQQYNDIAKELSVVDNEIVEGQLEYLTDHRITHDEFLVKQTEENNNALNDILSNPIGMKAYARKYNLDENFVSKVSGSMTKIPNSIFNDFNGTDDDIDNMT